MGHLLNSDEEAAVQQFLGSLEDPTDDPDAVAAAMTDAGWTQVQTTSSKGNKGRPKKAKPHTEAPHEGMAAEPTVKTADPDAPQLGQASTPRRTKASQIRELWAAGQTRSQIAKTLGIAYQQVFGVTKGLTAGAAVADPGNCQRCGKELVDPRTAKNGMGPVCAAKAVEEAEDDEPEDQDEN